MDELKEMLVKIFAKIEKGSKKYDDYEDAFILIKEFGKENLQDSLKLSKKLRQYIFNVIPKLRNYVKEMVELSDKTLLYEAPYLFDSYMIYLEHNRKNEEKFYLPRRKQLKVVVEALQDLVDDKLDELFLSMPPRVGKSTILLFFFTWIIGKNPESSNLYSAYSDTITTAFYNGIIEILTDSYTYSWQDVFYDRKIANTNAKEEILNINRKKRYPSLTCRSLYGTLNGACDCNGILASDDLIGGIEEALNKDRLVSAWSKVDNNLIPRAKENAKLIWVGTRWSIGDPAGRRMELLQTDSNFANRRFKIVNVPALNENDESNFEYKYNVGFTSDYYKKRRASFEKNNDMASWLAQYQGEPIEREGTLFTPDTMIYYNGVLPSGEPDRIFMPCDPAWGGGDFVAAPVLVQYDNVLYCPSVVFDSGDKTITRPKIVNQILKWKVQAARFEKNNGGDEYKDWVENELKAKGYKLNITSKMACTTKRKEQRIFDKAPEIREIRFLDANKRDKDYNMFMQNLFAFKITGKNKNDDAPDSLAMGIEMKNETDNKIEIMARPF